MGSGLRIGILAAAALIAGCAPRSAPLVLDPIGAVAPFQLLDQDGTAFTERELAGRVWVANFFFTSCPSICPPLTAAMAALERDFPAEPGLGFLSITVDPARDDPATLRAHAQAQGLPQARWRFLTGEREEIQRLCEASFRLAFGTEFDASGDLTHSSRFVLVDRAGQVRGYFDALDPAQRAPLRAAVRALLAEASGA